LIEFLSHVMPMEMDKVASHRFAVAPMMEWTDRHCRYFLRLISKRTFL
jgi:tRNA-dihydrouridine synthase A